VKTKEAVAKIQGKFLPVLPQLPYYPFQEKNQGKNPFLFT